MEENIMDFQSDTRVTIAPTGKEYHYEPDRYLDSSRNDNRRNPNRKKGWQVSEMWDMHHEIARRIILGENNQEIASALDCTPQTISNVRNSPVVKDKLSIMRAARDADTVDLSKDILELAPIALAKIREALETGMVLGKEVSSVSLLKEANNLLDRHMGKAVTRVESHNLNATLTLEDIERIKDKARSLTST
jgi:hypothetical protein